MRRRLLVPRVATRWGGRWCLPAALFLGFLCFVPALSADFFGDDFVFLSALDGHPPCTCTPYNLYDYSNGSPDQVSELVQQGIFPWWTLPDLKISLWRPLTSALLQLDHRLFGVAAPGYHAHSLLWFLMLVAVVGLLYRYVLPGGLSALAILVFAVDESHWLIVSWMSNRHAIVSATAAFLGLLCHVRWREQGWRAGLPLSLLAYTAGLAAGESGIQIFGFVAAYELVGAQGRRAQRIRALLPALGLGVIYLALYRAHGFGAHGAGAFIHPISEPARFLERAMLIAPSMLAELHLGTEVLYGLYRPPLPVLAAITAAVLVAITWLFLRSLRALPAEQARACRWLVLGTLLALLPPIASQRDAYFTSRSVLFASVGSAVGAASMLRYGWHLLRNRVAAAPGVRRIVTPVVGLIALMNLLVEPIATAMASWQLARTSHERMRVARQVDIDGAPGTEVVLLTGARALTGYGPLMRAVDRREPPHTWWSVSWSDREQELRRSGPRSFELAVRDGAFLRNDFERFHRMTATLVKAGQTFSNRLMRVEVLEAGTQGPTRLLFTLDRPLDDASLIYLAWQDGALRRVSLPALGEVMVLRPPPPRM